MRSATPIFFGTVTAAGKFQLGDKAGVSAHLKTLAGEAVEFTIRKRRTQRSVDQNAYLHAEPFPKLADHLGYSMEEVKLVLMGECFGWHDVGGHTLPVKPSTSSMTVEEAQYFIDWVIPWAMTEHGVHVRLPGEVEAA